MAAGRFWTFSSVKALCLVLSFLAVYIDLSTANDQSCPSYKNCLFDASKCDLFINSTKTKVKCSEMSTMLKCLQNAAEDSCYKTANYNKTNYSIPARFFRKYVEVKGRTKCKQKLDVEKWFEHISTEMSKKYPLCIQNIYGCISYFETSQEKDLCKKSIDFQKCLGCNIERHCNNIKAIKCIWSQKGAPGTQSITGCANMEALEMEALKAMSGNRQSCPMAENGLLAAISKAAVNNLGQDGHLLLSLAIVVMTRVFLPLLTD